MEREDYLAAVTIGERTPHNAQVELVEYDPEWPELYRREEEKIRGALGERALSGSSTWSRRRCPGFRPRRSST